MPINQLTPCKHCGVEHKLRGYSCLVCKNGLHRYKMTRLDMISLHEKQNKKCAICEKELELFIDRKGGFIDHCHKTNKVRGILCLSCNTFLGAIEKIGLEKVKDYLFR